MGVASIESYAILVIANVCNNEDWRVIMSCEDHFIQELHKRGYRLTPQREIVLRTLHEIEGLATVEEIYQQVQTTSTAIDISTVYRTLDLLQTFGLVASLEAEGGQRRYELLELHGPHIHLICRQCGAVTGVPMEMVCPWIAALQSEYGFAVDVSRFTVPGLCETCDSEDETG